MGQKDRRRKRLGYTLIELLLVVAITGILLAIVYPAFTDRLRQARRFDAIEALLALQNLQEKYRANNKAFGTLAQTGYPGTTSHNGFYNIAVNAPDETGYYSTAIAVTGTSQAEDIGCTTLTLTVNAGNPRGLRTPKACW